MATLATINIKAVLDSKGVQSGVAQAQKALNGFNGWVSGAFAAAFSGAAVAAFVGWGAKLAAEAEQAKVAFEVMLGSADKATKMLKTIKTFAAKTPFGEMDLQNAAKTMLAFGVAAEDIMPSLQMLGDISGGNAEKLKSLALVFGQISAGGRLTGGDLLQLINAGFNPLQVMAEKTGKSMSQLRDEMSKGMITFEMVKESFATATSDGGQFFGMMDKQSQTVAGRFSTLQDMVGDFARQFGEAFAPITSALLDMGAKFMEILIPTARAFLDTIVAMIMPVSTMPDVWGQVGFMIELAGGFAANLFSIIIGGWRAVVSIQQLFFTALQIGLMEAIKLWDGFWGNSTVGIEKEIARLYEFMGYYQEEARRGFSQIGDGFSGAASQEFTDRLNALKDAARNAGQETGAGITMAATAAKETLKVAFKDINPAALERGSSASASAIMKAQRDAQGNATERAMLKQLEAIAKNTGGPGLAPANI